MNIVNRIKSNFFWGFLGETLGRGLIFILLVIYSRRLGPEYFGHFSFIQSVFMFAWISIDLGLGLYGTRAIARAKTNVNTITNGILFTRTVLATLVALISVSISLITQNTEILMVVIGFSVFLILRGTQTDWFLRGFEDYKFLCLILTLSYLSLFLTGVVFVKSEQDFYLSSIGWAVMGSVATALGLYRIKYKYNIKLSFKRASFRQTAHYWKTSIHFTLSNGISALYETLPVFFLFAVSSPEWVGLYSVPFRLIVAAVFLMSIYPMTIFPVLSNLYKTNLNKYTQVINISALGIFILTATVSFICWLYAQEIIILMFTEKYSASVPAFKMLLIFFVFRSVRTVFVRAICAGDGEKTYSKIAFFGLGALLALMSALHFTQNLSLQSLATCLVITEFLIMFLLIKGVRKISNQDQLLNFGKS